MRDLLTVLAGLVIAVLLAALAVPPLLDWTAYRGAIDRGLSRALGQEVRTEGPLDLRLLPSPRLRVRRMRVGRDEAGLASLDGMFVRAEIALTPLLGGEVRILDARIGRAEVKLPVGTAGDWRLPAGLLDGADRRKGWALEGMRVEQFLLTTTEPATGRTDQLYADDVRIEANSALGPWRLSGKSRGRPLDIAIGEIAGDRTAALKIGLGGGSAPRADFDGQLALVPASGEALRPRFNGVLKWSAGGPEFPIRAQAKVEAGEGAADLGDIVVEAGEGVAAVRLSGQGHFSARQPRLDLKLAGRRIDAAALGRRFGAASEVLREGSPIPVELSLKLDSLGIGADEDLTGVSLTASVDAMRGELRALEFAGPGRSVLRAEGSFWLGGAPGGTGRVKLDTQDAQRLGRSLESLGPVGLSGLFQPRPLEAAAEISLVDPIVSLRNLRVHHGDLRLSGALRHSPAEEGARARLDAQLIVEGLDVSSLPQGSALFALAGGRDLGLSIDARDVVYAGRKGGRIAGRILTEGASIVVDGLEVRDLAGAEASLSGRIAPDGAGRIAGSLAAPRAAPLIDLLGQAAFGGLARLLPGPVRDGAVDLKVEVERKGGTDPAGSVIQTVLEGRLGGAPFQGITRTSAGVLTAFEVKTDVGALLNLPARAGSRVVLSGGRGGDGRIQADVSGEVGGIAIRTAVPIRLGEDDDQLESGEGTIAGPDARALFGRLGLRESAIGPDPVPISLRLVLSRRDGMPTLAATGEIAGTKVAAEIGGASASELSGNLQLDRLSLPHLASWLVLGPLPPVARGSVWPTGRFAGVSDPPFGGTIAMRVASLDLGLGLTGREAAFTLAVTPGGMRLSRLGLRLGEAQVRGEVGLDRQGGLVALSGAAIIEGLSVSRLLGGAFTAGRATATLRFGGSGESVAGIVANLGGAGDVAIEGLGIAEADAAAPARVAARVLKTDDPLASQRWQTMLGEELAQAPLGAVSPVTAPGAIVGGALRLSPLRIDAEAGSWQGSATFDLRNLSLDMRGALQSKELPRGWTGAPPTLSLGWTGSLGAISRAVDVAPLVNGLATNVLVRELDRVDLFEQDEAEQRRRRGQQEMERQRKADETRRQRAPEATETPATPR